MKNFDALIQADGKKAIRHYWKTRTGQLSPRRDGLYDATAFLMSDQRGGLKGEYFEPSDQLTLKRLAAEIYGKAVAYCKQRETATTKTGG